jgi:hypothetical protein
MAPDRVELVQPGVEVGLQFADRIAGRKPAIYEQGASGFDRLTHDLKVMNELKCRGIEDIPDRGNRRPEGLSGGDRGRLCVGLGSDLHRSSDLQFPGFRVLERSESRRRRTAQNLPHPLTRLELRLSDSRSR